MGFEWFSKTPKLSDLLIAQNQNLIRAAETLEELYVQFTDVSNKCELIGDLESHGNELSDEISHYLSQAFFTPLNRRDLHQINMTQEEALNRIKAISSRTGLYMLDTILPASKDLVRNFRIMAAETAGMLDQLFKKSPYEDHLQNIRKMKTESELFLLVALGELYESGTGGGSNSLHIIKWAQIYDRIEQAINSIVELASTIQGVASSR